MRTATALVVSIAVLGASPAPADAQFGRLLDAIESVAGPVVEVVESAVKEVERAAESTVKEAERAVENAVEAVESGVKEAERAAESTVKEAERAVENAVEVVESGVKEAERAAESTVKEAERAVENAVEAVESGVKEAEEFLKRCFERAEREPDPATREARIEKCEEKQTGGILGVVGTAVGTAFFGPPGGLAGGLAGSVVGSAIDGALTGYTGARIPVGSPSPDPAPDRTTAGETKDNEGSSELPQIELDDTGLPPGAAGRRLAYVSPDCERDAIAPYNCERFITDVGTAFFRPNRTPSGELSPSSLPPNWSSETRAMAALILKDRELAQKLVPVAFVAYAFGDPFGALANFNASPSGAGLIPRVQSCMAKEAVTHRRAQALLFSGPSKVKFNTRAESKWVEALEQSLAAHCSAR